MDKRAQSELWRVFLPLAPWGVTLLLLYAVLCPFGFGWVAPIVTLGCMALLLVHGWVVRR